MSITRHRLGLSLSGGGYRAAAFHLGTLKKLQEMKLLEQVDVISTISGGSITGACYCTGKDDYARFEKELYEGLQQKNVIRKVLLSGTFLQLVLFALLFLGPAFYFLFTPYAWLFPVLMAVMFFLLLKFQFHIFPVSKRIEKIYDQFFYDKKSLSDLPMKPTLVMGSTNLQTSRPFTFSRQWMQDSSYQYRKDPIRFNSGNFPIARAVMASSCVPFAFTPIKIDKQYFVDPADADKVHPLLVDGGVYDNQGIHKLMQNGFYCCASVIASDAGGSAKGELSFSNTVSLLISTVNTFMTRIKNAQVVDDVYNNTKGANKEIAYFCLGWDAANCIPGFIRNLAAGHITQTVIEAHAFPADWVEFPDKYSDQLTAYLKSKTGYDTIDKPTPDELKIARSVGTNLTALSKAKADALMKQAACMTELQVKLYCPSLEIRN